ncbi:hypothetical protein EV702DRAFT_1271560 [Suillus placidus]|uniref:Uncharacterized protein n=1 Tax=Suillus placidus TaxID=48579 RepID=A0A9P6ZJV2_9AGAM|nr:hypothetical protein EV702DRAFT_1271560 [Suillus placidus]
MAEYSSKLLKIQGCQLNNEHAYTPGLPPTILIASGSVSLHNTNNSTSPEDTHSDGIFFESPTTFPRAIVQMRRRRYTLRNVFLVSQISLDKTSGTFPVVPGHVIRRVIMTVEIKPEPCAGKTFDWESIWEDQVQEQVLCAFEADRTLKYLGVIIAAGRRWVYGTVDRGELVPRTMAEKRDPTFPSTGPSVPSSDNSMVEEWPKIQRFVPSLDIPEFLPQAKDGHPNTMYEFNLLDAGGESLRAFEGILNDLRHDDSDI